MRNYYFNECGNGDGNNNYHCNYNIFGRDGVECPCVLVKNSIPDIEDGEEFFYDENIEKCFRPTEAKTIKRRRQVRDAFNKCKDIETIEAIASILKV